MPRLESLSLKDECCAVCLEGLLEEASEMPCKHKFHSSCIESWLIKVQGSCPICRFVMPVVVEEEGRGQRRKKE